MKYSVLMSVYINDKAEYLKPCIESMLNQTAKPDQFVIVEDGKLASDCGKIIEDYKNGNPELFEVVKLEKNEGLANALNEGMKRCRNELVARMDADDVSLPTRCEKELKMFEKYPELAVCGCNIDEFSGDFYKTNLSSVCSKRFSYRLNLFSDSIKVSKEELFSEIAGFTSEFFGENAAEVGEVVKSDIETNLCYIEWGVEQQVFSFVEAECAQVFEHRFAGQCLEFAVKLGAAHGCFLAQKMNVKFFGGYIYFHECSYFADKFIFNQQCFVLQMCFVLRD